MPLQIIEKYDKPFEYAGILLNLIVAFQYFSLWSHPQLGDASQITTMTILMYFEFVLVHSGVFMALETKKKWYVKFIVFYGIFAAAFSLLLESHYILIAYVLIIINRTRFALSDVSPAIKDRVQSKSILVVLVYFFLIVAVPLTASYLPELGLTPEFWERAGYAYTNGDGFFERTPHAAMAFGFLYYCALAGIEAWVLKRNFA